MGGDPSPKGKSSSAHVEAAPRVPLKMNVVGNVGGQLELSPKHEKKQGGGCWGVVAAEKMGQKYHKSPFYCVFICSFLIRFSPCFISQHVLYFEVGAEVRVLLE